MYVEHPPSSLSTCPVGVVMVSNATDPTARMLIRGWLLLSCVEIFIEEQTEALAGFGGNLGAVGENGVGQSGTGLVHAMPTEGWGGCGGYVWWVRGEMVGGM